MSHNVRGHTLEGTKKQKNRIKLNINSKIRCDKTGNMEFYWNQFNISKKVSGWYLVKIIF